VKQKMDTTQTEQLTEAAPVIVVGGDNSVFANLAATLSEIRKLKGVIGYILRSNTAAIIDLTQKESVSEYASLSSQIHDCSRTISKQFNLTDVESILVEGKSVKVLCMCIGGNRMALFMDKTCTHAWIVKRILL
jgi:predicted regulator of Ras-like GTPase activity (Roadblock/LC7/MglB family)